MSMTTTETTKAPTFQPIGKVNEVDESESGEEIHEDPSFTFEFRPTMIVEILPNTERTRELRARRQLEEQKKREAQEKIVKEKEAQLMQLKQKKEYEEQQKKAEEERIKYEEMIAQEDLDELNKLKGPFGMMIQELKENNTRLDYTLTGMNLKPIQMRALIRELQGNTSLKGLVISRRKIDDVGAQDLINQTSNNQCLEHLELDGNNLGPESLVFFAELLVQNTTIRALDLENNNLTNTYVDHRGVEALCKALETNTSLLSLNLTNTMLDAECSDLLLGMMKENQTLINLDIAENPKMNLYQVREIQQLLIANKKEYDHQRYLEFMERKRQWNEEALTTEIQMRKETQKLLQDNIDLRIDVRRRKLQQQWDEEMEAKELAKQKEIMQLMKEAQARASKKHRRHGAKKAK